MIATTFEAYDGRFILGGSSSIGECGLCWTVLGTADPELGMFCTDEVMWSLAPHVQQVSLNSRPESASSTLSIVQGRLFTSEHCCICRWKLVRSSLRSMLVKPVLSLSKNISVVVKVLGTAFGDCATSVMASWAVWKRLMKLAMDSSGVICRS